jgi:hypothetical protein
MMAAHLEYEKSRVTKTCEDVTHTTNISYFIHVHDQKDQRDPPQQNADTKFPTPLSQNRP